MSKAKISILAVLLIVVLVISTFPLPVVSAATIGGQPWKHLRIIRDDYGVPHVFSDTKVGLGFGAGYAMAQDRLWQADVLRRTAEGRLAELLGPSVLAQDMQMRAQWYNQTELQAIYDAWDPGAGYEHLKPMIEAYVNGINLYISEALAAALGGNLSLIPVEYIGIGVDKLKPFTVADVVAVTVLMAWRFGGTGGNEGTFYEALLTLQAMNGPATGYLIWNETFPLNDPGAPVTIPDAVYGASLSVPSFDFPDGVGGLLQQYDESRAAQDEQLASLGLPTKFGSNAVLISPELSATGNALELGGPQMGYTVPQIVYEIGLHGAGISAQGMSIAGAGPFILIGVSEYGAWTSTTGSSDVLDIRILVLNPVNPLQYWHDGAWRNMEVRTETFQVRGSPNATGTFYRSHYGPIVGMNIAAHTAITLHTPFYRNEIAAEQGWELFQEATNIDEFEAAVELVWPSHNFYWADRKGNIGYWHAGRFPVKPVGADRRLPLMGDGTQEWVNVTGPEEMPHCINPEQGWLTNWNNKPIADWPYAESDFGWGEGHRVQILMNALGDYYAPRGDVTFDDMNTINQIAGYTNINGMNFVADLIAAVTAYLGTTPDPEVAEALGYLVAWATAEPLPVSYVDLVSPKWPTDSNPTYDHAGLTIFNAWYDTIVPAVFTGILPPSIIGQIKGNPSLLLRVFRGETTYDYLGGRDRDTLIVNALKDAIVALKVQYGSDDMSTWLTPVRMQRYDAQGALPGGYYHPYMNRGTYNQIAEMLSTPPSQAKPSAGAKGSPPHAVSVIPPGQSGFVRYPGVPSPYAFNQLPLYAAWQYKHMLFRSGDIEAVETWRRVF